LDFIPGNFCPFSQWQAELRLLPIVADGVAEMLPL